MIVIDYHIPETEIIGIGPLYKKYSSVGLDVQLSFSVLLKAYSIEIKSDVMSVHDGKQYYDNFWKEYHSAKSAIMEIVKQREGGKE